MDDHDSVRIGDEYRNDVIHYLNISLTVHKCKNCGIGEMDRALGNEIEGFSMPSLHFVSVPLVG